jgi:diguanylate cyclase (GGDEF)-like protein
MQAHQEERLRKSSAWLASAKRIHFAVLGAYFYELLVLFGFAAAGYVSFEIAILFTGVAVIANILVFLAHQTGWSLKFSDPALFLPQQLLALLLAFALGLAAPQLAIQSFATCIATSFFGFLAPGTKKFFVAWTTSVACAAAIVYFRGASITMPTATPAGQALTFGIIFGIFGHGIGVANLVGGLRQRLHDKNGALRAAMARIEMLAQQDELTGLPNRRAVVSWLGEQLEFSDRTGLPLTIALLDIDHFKSVNDGFGHLVGDRVLQGFSQRASASIRATDRLGRFGGEEFLLLMPATALQDAKQPLERLRQQISSHDWPGIGKRLHVTVTIGAAAYRRGETIEQLLNRADVALYRGKAATRNIVTVEDAPEPVALS